MSGPLDEGDLIDIEMRLWGLRVKAAHSPESPRVILDELLTELDLLEERIRHRRREAAHAAAKP